jgi:hypothetical protein
MSKKPERLSHLCKQNSQYTWLAARARELGKLNIILQKSLPLQFSNHCRLANITADKVVIHTDKASYASMLRFQAPLICKTLSGHLPEPVNRLEVKVRPLETIQRQTSQASEPLSTKTAALIKSTAEEIEDGPLKTALNKLARRQQD